MKFISSLLSAHISLDSQFYFVVKGTAPVWEDPSVKRQHAEWLSTG